MLFICKNMDSGEPKDTSGYGKPPWIFKGSALYQLHLVKSKTARACIPKDFRLVEAFGYTLGGFFLASYDDSPAGVFDELVVIAGLVWNPPTSVAWATKVLVNSDEACEHGRKEVGLPSQVARFSKKMTAIPRQKHSSRSAGFLNMIGIGTSLSDWYSTDHMDVQVAQLKGPYAEDPSSFNFTSTVSAFSLDKWMGPTIKMSLPSFSGRTEDNPDLLKYSCKIQCRVRAVQPARVSGPALKSEMEQSSDAHNSKGCTSSSLDQSTKESISTAVMLSKPIFALKFSCMTMQVEAPVVISDCPKTTLRTC